MLSKLVRPSKQMRALGNIVPGTVEMYDAASKAEGELNAIDVAVVDGSAEPSEQMAVPESGQSSDETIQCSGEMLMQSVHSKSPKYPAPQPFLIRGAAKALDRCDRSFACCVLECNLS